MEKNPHIIIIPSPGMGHLIPLGEFAKQLALTHGFFVTFIIPTDSPLSKAENDFLQGLAQGISHVALPPVNLDDVAEDAMIETRISLTVVRSLSSIRDVANSLAASTRLVAMVVDLFGTDAFKVAQELNISPYIFFPSTATTLSFFLYLQKLDESVSCEYRDLPGIVQIPGCDSLRGSDLLDPVQDRKNDAYKWVLYHTKRYKMAEGIMVNSFKELEFEQIKALQKGESGNPPVYPVGPLVNTLQKTEKVDRLRCLKWLNDQPHGSVLFISFGSGGTLSSNQIQELAFGLELSEQKFLWVIRTPNDEVANGSYFGVNRQDDPLAFLPDGFIERTNRFGIVVPFWAPQAQILGHCATGGFLTHCGWNSTLESVYNGVPLIAWPLYAEQKMNAVILTKDLKVAIRAEIGENGLIRRSEIAKLVKILMEGEEGKQLRKRMRELKGASAKVLSKNGDSTRTLMKLATVWKGKLENN